MCATSRWLTGLAVLAVTLSINPGTSVFGSEVCGDMLDLLRVADQAFREAYTIEGRHNFVDANKYKSDGMVDFCVSGMGDKRFAVDEQSPYAAKHDSLPIRGVNYVGTASAIQEYLAPGRKSHVIRCVMYGEEAGVWKARYETEWLDVAEDRTIRNSWTGAPLLVKYGTNPGCTWLFAKHLLPLGRGYSEFIDSVVSCEVDEEGIATVEVTGNMFGPGERWELKIDTKASYLVGSASLDTGGLQIVLQGGGDLAWDSAKELPIHSSGSFRVQNGPLEEMWVTKYERTAGAEMMAEQKRTVGDAAAPHTGIVDFTLRDTDNNIWTHMVREGEE